MVLRLDQHTLLVDTTQGTDMFMAAVSFENRMGYTE